MRRLALALLALASCSKSATPEEGDLAEDTSLGGAPDGGGVFNPGGGGATKQPECSEDTKDVFVISEENSLYRFHPPTLEFTNLGLVKCPTGGATPTSMAVDRNGVAWVRHSDGSIWKVSTKDLSCEGTSFVPPGNTDGAFFKFGMGFATSSNGGSNEELFLSDNAGGGLAKLDTDTMQLRFIGRYTGELDGKTSELTGTGAGKLYGFFVDAPGKIAEVSKGTGEIVNVTPLTGVYAGNAWAFSFYGGDFYIYTSSEGSGGLPRSGTGSDVTRFRPSDGSIEIVKPKVGFKIVGAGVSTCAPTTGGPR